MINLYYIKKEKNKASFTLKKKKNPEGGRGNPREFDFDVPVYPQDRDYDRTTCLSRHSFQGGEFWDGRHFG